MNGAAQTKHGSAGDADSHINWLAILAATTVDLVRVGKVLEAPRRPAQIVPFLTGNRHSNLYRPPIRINRGPSLAAILNALLVYVMAVCTQAVKRPPPKLVFVAVVPCGVVADRGRGADASA
jgi:hypothetical protein